MPDPGPIQEARAEGTRPVVHTVLILGIAAFVCGCTTPQSGTDEPEELVGEPERPARTAAEASETQPDAVREGALWYRIALGGRYLEITLRLLRPADRSSFFLPKPERDGAAGGAAVTVEGAYGPDGPLSHNQLPDEGRIDVDTSGLDWVELVYRIDLEAFPNDAAQPLPDITGKTVLGYLPALLVVPSRRIVSDIREIPIEIHTPAEWDVRATWPNAERDRSEHRDGRDVHGFVATDIRALRDAFFVAGPDLSTRRAGDESIAVAFQPGFDIPKEPFVDLVQRIARAYRERFDPVGPILTYARPAPRKESPGLRGTAKRNGFVVRLPERRPLRTTSRILVAHEAFHLWNGHHAIPEPDAERDIRWFEEGVTHYMAVKTLFKIGLIDFEHVRRQLAESAFFYRRNPAAGEGRASRLDVDRLPYDRGLLLGLALDGVLHECTGGSSSATAWIRSLLHEEPTYYDAQTLRDAYLETAGAECSSAQEIWERSVAGDGSLEPSELLDEVGLHYIEASTVEESKVLPIDGEDQIYESLFERSARATESDSAARTARKPKPPQIP